MSDQPTPGTADSLKTQDEAIQQTTPVETVPTPAPAPGSDTPAPGSAPASSPASAPASDTPASPATTDAQAAEAAAAAAVETAVVGQASDAAVNQELEKALEGGDVDAMLQASLESPAADAEADDKEVVHADFIRARVTAIRGEDVFVDPMSPIPGVTGGAKLQGVVPLSQFDRPPRIGAIMEFLVDRVDNTEGLIHLNREGAVQNATWQRLERGMVVEARCTGSNKGGLELEMPGQIRAFMPASQIDIAHVEDIAQFVGQRLEARVHEIDRKHKRVIISRREHIQKQRDLLKAKTLQELTEGDVVKGTVNKVMDYGAFIDIGGVDGLLHVSDMSHSRVSKPSEIVKQNDQVEVKILKIDKAKGRVSLGLKQITQDPWTTVSFTEGEMVSGRITRTAAFGCFVEIADGVEGLMPISEIAWKRINKPDDVVKQGEVVQVKIIKVEQEKKKLTLSLKQATGDPWEASGNEFEVGAVVTGKVVSTTDFGAFVELKPGVEGMVHISELAGKRVDQVTDIIKAGDEREFRVIGVEAQKRRIKLSVKQVEKLDTSKQDRAEARRKADQEADAIKAQAKARLRPKNQLKGGGLDSPIMGTGLGGLKL